MNTNRKHIIFFSLIALYILAITLIAFEMSKRPEPAPAAALQVATATMQPDPIVLSPANDFQYAAIDVDALNAPDRYVVCVDELAVKDNPGDQFPALYYIHAGDEVTVYERSRGHELGWAMIEPIRWVWSQGLCRAEDAATLGLASVPNRTR